MRKRLIILTILLVSSFVLTAGALAREQCLVSDEQTAAAAIKASSGWFHGITVITDGTNSVTISIYDNASAASGTELIPTWIVTTSSANRAQTYSVSPPVRTKNGIYVNVTTSGTVTYMVYYE